MLSLVDIDCSEVSIIKNDLTIISTISLSLQDDDFAARDDFEDADQLQIGNDGIFMLTFFSKSHLEVESSPW